MTKFANVLKRWEHKELSAQEAGELLGCSERQTTIDGADGIGQRRRARYCLGGRAGSTFPDQGRYRFNDRMRGVVGNMSQLGNCFIVRITRGVFQMNRA